MNRKIAFKSLFIWLGKWGWIKSRLANMDSLVGASNPFSVVLLKINGDLRWKRARNGRKFQSNSINREIIPKYHFALVLLISGCKVVLILLSDVLNTFCDTFKIRKFWVSFRNFSFTNFPSPRKNSKINFPLLKNVSNRKLCLLAIFQERKCASRRKLSNLLFNSFLCSVTCVLWKKKYFLLFISIYFLFFSILSVVMQHFTFFM